MSLNLRELLDKRVLIGDGAIGTLLGDPGFCLLVGLMPLRSRAYIMPPASAPDLAGDMLEAIGLPNGI